MAARREHYLIQPHYVSCLGLISMGE